MDDRISQKKELKKAYIKLRDKAGLGWRIPGHLLMDICLIVTCITVFVLCNQMPVVSYIDTKLWEPLKAAVDLPVPYAAIWNLAARYGMIAAVVTGILGIICLTVGGCKKAAVKKTDAYLNYRTMKLTLETEKEEA